MTYTTIASREKLKGLFDIDKLSDTDFRITITPISEEDKLESDFKSLKGIYGQRLTLDDIRKERLGI